MNIKEKIEQKLLEAFGEVFKEIEALKPTAIPNKNGRKRVYEVELDDGRKLSFTPYRATTYKKAGNRLRNSDGTRYEIYIDLQIKHPNGRFETESKSFGVVVGEGKDAALVKKREKAQAWMKKHLNVDIGEYDFNY